MLTTKVLRGKAGFNQNRAVSGGRMTVPLDISESKAQQGRISLEQSAEIEHYKRVFSAVSACESP
ncbi:MAG: hypothetical protein ACKPJD_18610, partial [Planctomycetaceae bacterium]